MDLEWFVAQKFALEKLGLPAMSPRKSPPLALAVEWVAKITTIALEMVLPGFAGLWLDGRWHTTFLGLVGFVLGVSLAIWHLTRLLPLAKDAPGRKSRSTSSDRNNSENDTPGNLS